MFLFSAKMITRALKLTDWACFPFLRKPFVSLIVIQLSTKNRDLHRQNLIFQLLSVRFACFLKWLRATKLNKSCTLNASMHGTSDLIY